MDLATLIDLITKNGLGVASFVVMCVFVYWWRLDSNLLRDNHLTHMQESLEKILEVLSERLPPKS
jgi:Flp pilus assembly protein TadB